MYSCRNAPSCPKNLYHILRQNIGCSDPMSELVKMHNRVGPQLSAPLLIIALSLFYFLATFAARRFPNERDAPSRRGTGDEIGRKDGSLQRKQESSLTILILTPSPTAGNAFGILQMSPAPCLFLTHVLIFGFPCFYTLRQTCFFRWITQLEGRI